MDVQHRKAAHYQIYFLCLTAGLGKNIRQIFSKLSEEVQHRAQMNPLDFGADSWRSLHSECISGLTYSIKCLCVSTF